MIRRVRSRPAPREDGRGADALARIFLAAAALIVVAFVVLNFRYTLLSDGFQVWASKAQLLAARGSLGPDWYPGETFDRRLATYPPLLPLFEAQAAALRGAFDFDRLKAVFPLFYLSMLVSTHATVRRRAGPRLASAAVLLVALLPLLTTQSAAGGFADMPEAAFVAGTLSAALRAEGHGTLPWMIGSLTTVKSEGILLALIASAAAVLFWRASRPPGLLGRLRAHAKGVAIVGAFLTLRLAYLRWLDFDDPQFAFDPARLGETAARIPVIAARCLASLFDLREWALLWPAFLAGGWILVRRGRVEERLLVLATAAAALAYATVFLFTTWPLELHIQQAWPRLLAQIAPAAVTVAVLGYANASQRLDEAPAD